MSPRSHDVARCCPIVCSSSIRRQLHSAAGRRALHPPSRVIKPRLPALLVDPRSRDLWPFRFRWRRAINEAVGEATGITHQVGDDVAGPSLGSHGARSSVPVPRAGVSVRAVVGERLAQAAGRVVVVCAPGGYGKSSQVAGWAAGDGRPAAWVDLERVDNDPVVLLACSCSCSVASPTSMRTRFRRHGQHRASSVTSWSRRSGYRMGVAYGGSFGCAVRSAGVAVHAPALQMLAIATPADAAARPNTHVAPT